MLNALPLSEQNLILTGYIGPGQAQIGQQIAERLGMPVVNIEQQIAEQMELSPDEIRSYFGETRLKTIENRAVDDTLLRRRSLIRVRASTLLHGSNLARLRDTGPVICLVTTLDAMLHRLHVAMGARYYNPYERGMELGELKREWSIRGMAGIHEVDTTYRSTEEVIETVTSLWHELSIVRG